MFLTSKIYTAWKSNARALGLGKHNHCRWAAWTPGRVHVESGAGRRGNSHKKVTWVGGTCFYGLTRIPS